MSEGYMLWRYAAGGTPTLPVAAREKTDLSAPLGGTSPNLGEELSYLLRTGESLTYGRRYGYPRHFRHV